MSMYRTLKLRGHETAKTVIDALSIYLETGKPPAAAGEQVVKWLKCHLIFNVEIKRMGRA